MDWTGQPAASASLRVFRGNTEIAQTLCDLTGKGELLVFPSDGVFEIRGRREELGGALSGLTLKPGERRVVDLQLDRAVSISGHVLTLDGKTPQSAVPVQAMVRDGDKGALRIGAMEFTDDDGVFRFVNLRPGEYWVRCLTPWGNRYFGNASRADTVLGLPVVVVPGQTGREVGFKLPEIKKGTWRGYTSYEGLDHENIRCLYRAPGGELWIGTISGGVYRFDGSVFEQISTAQGLVGNQVFCIGAASDGALWFGTSEGAVHYDGKTFKNFGKEDGLPDLKIFAIEVESNGAVWFGSEVGLSRFDSEGLIQYSNRDGLINRSGGTSGVFAIDIEEDGDLWAGTEWGGVFRFQGDQFQKVLSSSEKMYVRKTVRTPDGTRWFGTSEGLFRFENNQIVKVLNRSWVMALESDQKGALWMGSGWARPGVVQLNPASGSMVSNSEDLGLAVSNVWAVTKRPNGEMWLGTDVGIQRFVNGRLENSVDSLGFETGSIWCFFEDGEGGMGWGGKSWFGPLARWQGNDTDESGWPSR